MEKLRPPAPKIAQRIGEMEVTMLRMVMVTEVAVMEETVSAGVSVALLPMAPSAPFLHRLQHLRGRHGPPPKRSQNG